MVESLSRARTPLLSVLGQSGQIRRAAGQGGVIDLKVTGLDHNTGGAVDGKRHCIRDGVVDVDGLHREAAKFDLFAGQDLHKLCAPCQAELLQLIADQAAGQPGAVDGQVHLLQQIGDAANVILVAVGDQQALDLILILQHKAEIRDHQVHAEHIAVREYQAAVHNDHITAALVNGHIFAHFAQAAQGVDMDLGRIALLGLRCPAGTALAVRTAGTGPLLPCFSHSCGGGALVFLFF